MHSIFQFNTNSRYFVQSLTFETVHFFVFLLCILVYFSLRVFKDIQLIKSASVTLNQLLHSNNVFFFLLKGLFDL